MAADNRFKGFDNTELIQLRNAMIVGKLGPYRLNKFPAIQIEVAADPLWTELNAELDTREFDT